MHSEGKLNSESAFTIHYSEEVGDGGCSGPTQSHVVHY